MQRFRIGLTGLAFIFVLVLLAAVISSPRDEAPITANAIEQELATGTADPAPTPVAEPKEPLAELGMTPGSDDANESVAAPPVAAVPQP